jgi:alpha-L-rhamnosidase
MKPVRLKTNHHVNPLGIDSPQPSFSWQLGADAGRFQQSACELRVHAGSDVVWESGVVSGSQSHAVVYDGTTLKSQTLYSWAIRVQHAEGEWSDWSEPAFFEMGLLERDEWKGQWIGETPRTESETMPASHLRSLFKTEASSVKRARLYATAGGLYEVFINGERVGEDVLAPGWTNYSKRRQVIAYDVTSLIQSGDNAIGAMLGEGWFCGYLFYKREREFYGTDPHLLLQLEIEYADGTTQTVCTDENWKVTSNGPIVLADLYDGEVYDAAKELGDWSLPQYDDSGWHAAHAYEDGGAQLVSKLNPPIRRIAELKTVELYQSSPGVNVFNLGQNMVGWVRLKVTAPRGTRITIKFGEWLNDDRSVYRGNLRTAKATDTYICKGGGEEVFEPHFTFHGFQYVELVCDNDAVVFEADSITGIVLCTDMERTGSFECSDPLINRLQQNIVWGQRGNFLDVPTDCPQRDERVGWTGDAQVFVGASAFNYNVETFFEKWLCDLSDDQRETGAYPDVAPDVVCKSGEHWPNPPELWQKILRPSAFGEGGCAAWADAGIICPWVIYERYGDARILERQYESMAAFLNFLEDESNDLIRPFEGFGDWLAIDTSPAEIFFSPTPQDLIGTAYFAYDADLMANSAEVLGKEADAERYRMLAKNIKKAFCDEFVSPNGRIAGDTQTAYLLALGFDLIPESMQGKVFENLMLALERRGWKLSTGFLGTPLLCPVLTKFGRTDIAYRMLLQQEFPSWLYSVLQGATTMWERWNSWTKEDGFENIAMNSFNHYAYGAVGDWMAQTVGGISFAEPGYKKVRIAPIPGEGITWAKASYESPYGKISVDWKTENDAFELNCTIPPNTTAEVLVAGADASLALPDGMTLQRETAAGLECIAMPGTYFVKRITP